MRKPMSEYTPSSIKILTTIEAEDRMPWLKAEALAAKYHRPMIFIQRGLEAYELAGSTAQAFVGRYLDRKPDAPRSIEAEMISRKLRLKMKKYFMVYTVPGYSEWILDEPEFKILLACKVMNGLSTTNTDIKLLAHVDMPAAEIGIIMARLRAARLIDYRHVETGRKAAGSGRFELIYKADPFSLEPVLKAVASRLPPLPSS